MFLCCGCLFRGLTHYYYSFLSHIVDLGTSRPPENRVTLFSISSTKRPAPFIVATTPTHNSNRKLRWFAEKKEMGDHFFILSEQKRNSLLWLWIERASSVEVWKCGKCIYYLRLTHLSLISYCATLWCSFRVRNIWWADVSFQRISLVVNLLNMTAPRPSSCYD